MGVNCQTEHWRSTASSWREQERSLRCNCWREAILWHGRTQRSNSAKKENIRVTFACCCCALKLPRGSKAHAKVLTSYGKGKPQNNSAGLSGNRPLLSLVLRIDVFSLGNCQLRQRAGIYMKITMFGSVWKTWPLSKNR